MKTSPIHSESVNKSAEYQVVYGRLKLFAIFNLIFLGFHLIHTIGLVLLAKNGFPDQLNNWLYWLNNKGELQPEDRLGGYYLVAGFFIGGMNIGLWIIIEYSAAVKFLKFTRMVFKLPMVLIWWTLTLISTVLTIPAFFFYVAAKIYVSGFIPPLYLMVIMVDVIIRIMFLYVGIRFLRELQGRATPPNGFIKVFLDLFYL